MYSAGGSIKQKTGKVEDLFEIGSVNHKKGMRPSRKQQNRPVNRALLGQKVLFSFCLHFAQHPNLSGSSPTQNAIASFGIKAMLIERHSNTVQL